MSKDINNIKPYIEYLTTRSLELTSNILIKFWRDRELFFGFYNQLPTNTPKEPFVDTVKYYLSKNPIQHEQEYKLFEDFKSYLDKASLANIKNINLNNPDFNKLIKDDKMTPSQLWKDIELLITKNNLKLSNLLNKPEYKQTLNIIKQKLSSNQELVRKSNKSKGFKDFVSHVLCDGYLSPQDSADLMHIVKPDSYLINELITNKASKKSISYLAISMMMTNKSEQYLDIYSKAGYLNSFSCVENIGWRFDSIILMSLIYNTFNSDNTIQTTANALRNLIQTNMNQSKYLNNMQYTLTDNGLSLSENFLEEQLLKFANMHIKSSKNADIIKIIQEKPQLLDIITSQYQSEELNKAILRQKKIDPPKKVKL